jgi:phosphoglycerate kinase
MSLGEMPVNKKIYDIGKESADYFSRIILSLGENEAIFYKGAPGNFEVKGFDYGSKKILDALSKTKAFVIISGGSGSDALKKFGLKKDDFDYISLSGGALVKYISGEKLEGLEALK